MAQTIVAPTGPVDHAALDVILTNLERRYGHEPRIDRAYRIVMSGRVELSENDPKTALVHGDSGRDYWATVDGFCECPDAERVARCKHSLACIIVAQLAAVAKAKAAQQDDLCETFARLTREHQVHGRALIASGVRPVDDATYRERDEQIQAMRHLLPAATLIR
jgi:hypothetical protein